MCVWSLSRACGVGRNLFALGWAEDFFYRWYLGRPGERGIPWQAAAVLCAVVFVLCVVVGLAGPTCERAAWACVSVRVLCITCGGGLLSLLPAADGCVWSPSCTSEPEKRSPFGATFAGVAMPGGRRGPQPVRAGCAQACRTEAGVQCFSASVRFSLLLCNFVRFRESGLTHFATAAQCEHGHGDLVALGAGAVPVAPRRLSRVAWRRSATEACQCCGNLGGRRERCSSAEPG